MIAITEVLSSEHRVFTELFDQIERLLPGLTTLSEVRLVICLLEHLLQSHANAEQNLAYAALDHALNNEGHLDRLYEDHEEIDASLRRARTARSFEGARRLLKLSITASREHFRREERSVFPLLEQVLQRDTLAALGTARVRPRAAL
jgi:hemerythrin-like domain-containing protein